MSKNTESYNPYPEHPEREEMWRRVMKWGEIENRAAELAELYKARGWLRLEVIARTMRARAEEMCALEQMSTTPEEDVRK